MLPLSQNIDNSSTIFITNKLLKQNSQTFEKILSPFLVCNFFFDFWPKFGNIFQQHSAKNNKLTNVCQNFTNFLSSAWNLAKVWRNYWQVPISQMFHEIFAIFFHCVFVLLLPSVCIILNETKFLFMRSTLHFSVHLQYMWYIEFVVYSFFRQSSIFFFLNAVLERKQWVKKCTLEWIGNFSDF